VYVQGGYLTTEETVEGKLVCQWHIKHRSSIDSEAFFPL